MRQPVGVLAVTVARPRSLVVTLLVAPLLLLLPHLVTAGEVAPPPVGGSFGGVPVPAAPAPAPSIVGPPVREDQVEMAQQRVSGRTDMRRQGASEVVSARKEVELSSELVFVTSRGAMAGVPQLSFTDAALGRFQVALTPAARLRITGVTTFLLKQPATDDEPLWQSAGLGARYGVNGWAAVGLDGSFGKLLANLGHHGSLAVGVLLRRQMNEYVIWQGRLGASGTRFWPSRETEATFWFAEANGSGELQLCWDRCRRRMGATWLGIDLAVPFLHRPAAIDLADPILLDPRTRLGLTVGSFFTVTDTWDVYGTVSWIDRGDPAVPATQLPILDGGFDQLHIAFGLIAHWWLEPPPRSTVYSFE